MSSPKADQSVMELDGLDSSQDKREVGSPLPSPNISPDQFDVKFETSKQEIWAYYAYYIGNSGLFLYQWAPIAFQNVLAQAAGESGILPFAGRNRNVNSIVLLANGFSFCIQVIVFLGLGSFADFGTWRPNILIGLTVVMIAVAFAWLGVHTLNKWETGAALYILGLALYTSGYCFWTAAFPGLARNTPALRREAEKLNAGTISRGEYDQADSMGRSKLYNTASYVIAPAQVAILAVCVGILYGLNVNASQENSNWAVSVIMAFGGGIIVLTSLPWFVLEKRRPGQSPPPVMSIPRAGLWQWYQTATQIWSLKQTLIYLIGFFLMSDSFNTAVVVTTTLQNQVVEYDLITLTYLTMVEWAGLGMGIYCYWFVQRKFNLSTKTMFITIAVFIIVMDVWGLVGIWTQTIGFHQPWEFWLFQAWLGLFVSPYYSYSQIMISEVTPRGKEFLFFSFFNIVGTTTSFIGPVVSSAIIDASPSRNGSLPYYFLTALSLVSFLLILLFVDLDKSRVEQGEFLEREKRRKEEIGSGNGGAVV